MIISQAAVSLKAHHQYSEKREVRESLEFWIDRLGSPTTVSSAFAAADQVTLSEQVRTEHVADVGIDEKMLHRDFRLEVFRMLIERMTGRKIDILSPDDLKNDCRCDEISPLQGQGEVVASEGVGWGLIYEYSETYAESETTSFNASGIIRTADGREIGFAIELTMSRSFFSETHVSLRAGDALKDPLVINFGGNAAALSDLRFEFDLDGDGELDNLARLRPGSGFLALDRNGDNLINDGTELFGPRSGDGFAELAAHDHDGNGWIDEQDPVFNDLRVWIVDSSKEDRMFTLAEVGIGAIYLNSIATPFAHKNLNGELLGVTRNTGIHLYENGTIGTLQHLDLVV